MTRVIWNGIFRGAPRRAGRGQVKPNFVERAGPLYPNLEPLA
jgi:hypothetical protein